MGALTVNEAIGFDPEYPAVSSSAPARQSTFQPATTSSYGAQSDALGGKGKAIAQTLSQKDRYITGTPGDTEKFDETYQVRRYDWKKFFRVGRVFSTLWSDAVGGNDVNNDTFVSVIIYGEKVHSKVRRFVIVREGERSCTCLPVTSYGGRGYRKANINLKEHGFIYSHKEPNPVDGLGMQSLKVKLSKHAAPISDPSLVNYGAVYTVQTNVKVKDVGELDSESRTILRYYWRRVFGIDEDTPSPVPALTPRTKAADLAGVGGAGYDYIPASQPGPYTSPIATSTSYATTSSGHQTMGSYGAAGGTAGRYATSTGYPAPTGNVPQIYGSTTSYQPTETRYAPSNTYTTSANTYPAGRASTAAPVYSTGGNTSGYPSTYQSGEASGNPPYVSQGTARDYYPSSIAAAAGGSYDSDRYQSGQKYSTDPTTTYAAHTSSTGTYVSHGPSGEAYYPASTASVSGGSYTSDHDYQSSHKYSSSTSHHGQAIEEDDIRLPTIEEARESRRPQGRRESSSRSHISKGKEKSRR
jgi:hypothetical protein